MDMVLDFIQPHWLLTYRETQKGVHVKEEKHLSKNKC